jgi:hypothetical protein
MTIGRADFVGVGVLGEECSMFGRMFAVCLMLFWPAIALAHQGKGPHGGLVSDAGSYYVELVAKEKQLQVFVFDDKTDGPVKVKGASATATVLVGQEKQTVTLHPAPPDTDDNVMVGQLGTSAAAGMRIVVLIHLPDKPSVVARFAL